MGLKIKPASDAQIDSTASPGPTQYNLADLFEAVAAAVPERIAVRTDEGALSYGELNTRSDSIAWALAARGIRRGDTVGLYLMNGPEYLEVFIAACKIGAVPFNVNYRYGVEELRYLFDNAHAAAIVFNEEFEPLAREAAATLPHLRMLIAVGGVGEGGEAVLSYDALLKTNAAGGAFTRSESDILLQYTGGTTGMPKGVIWPHKAFFFACLGGGGFYQPDGPVSQPGEIIQRAREGYRLSILPVAPLMHGAAIWTAWSALLGGLTLVLDPMRSFNAEAIWDRVEAHGVNIVQIVGDAMAAPLRDALREHSGRWSLDHVVSFGSGGAVFSAYLKAEIASLLPGARIMDGMGTSEGGVSGAAEPSADGMLRLPANADQQVIVEDRIGKVGEIGLLGRSGHTPIGYYRDPVKSAEVFRTIDGRLWTLSGDQGRLDDDGMITIFGRGSTCINTGGEKVFPEEVESALRAHPAIHDAVVVGRPHERWGESVVGIVSLVKGHAAPSLGEVRTFLGSRLAGYKCPKDLIIVDEVRRSAAGKQDYAWARSLACQDA